MSLLHAYHVSTEELIIISTLIRWWKQKQKNHHQTQIDLIRNIYAFVADNSEWDG